MDLQGVELGIAHLGGHTVRERLSQTVMTQDGRVQEARQHGLFGRRGGGVQTQAVPDGSRKRRRFIEDLGLREGHR